MLRLRGGGPEAEPDIEDVMGIDMDEENSEDEGTPERRKVSWIVVNYFEDVQTFKLSESYQKLCREFVRKGCKETKTSVRKTYVCKEGRKVGTEQCRVMFRVSYNSSSEQILLEEADAQHSHAPSSGRVNYR